MSAASRYWLLYRLDAAGNRKIEEIAAAKAFFTEAFPELTHSENVPDAKIQRQLWHWWRTASSVSGNGTSHPAALCLRCYISSTIEQVVIQLEIGFGSYYGFTRKDLFPLVLNDIIVEHPEKQTIGSYTSVATEILQTFNPERSSLSNWASKLAKQHDELRAFLVEHGVYLVTDWAILNDTDTEQLRRVLNEFHHLSPIEIEQASILLDSYHAVYRRDRRTARKAGNTGQCPLPTQEQLQQIAQRLDLKTHLTLQADEVMNQLQDIAEHLRHYRIYAKSGALPSESLDAPIGGLQEQIPLVEQIPSPNSTEDEDEAAEFLQFYRKEFNRCLERALYHVIRHRFNALQKQNTVMAERFILALNLYYCQGQSMGQIASQIGLQAQYQVTRFLKLKQIRTDVKQLMLKFLVQSVLERAITCNNLVDAKNLEQKIEIALDDQVTAIIQEAEAESTLARCRPLNSLFAQRLCSTLIIFLRNFS